MAEEAGSVLNQEMTPRASRFPCIADQQTSWVGRIPILILRDFCCYKMVSRILTSGFHGFNKNFHPVCKFQGLFLASFPGLS